MDSDNLPILVGEYWPRCRTAERKNERVRGNADWDDLAAESNKLDLEINWNFSKDKYRTDVEIVRQGDRGNQEGRQVL